MNEWNASQWDATVFRQLHRHWALLTAGSIAHYNAMTINWGGFGTLWQKPTVTVYVKPARYTHDYMMEQEYFSVSFFPERYHQDLVYLGTASGRQTDKLSQTSLTPEQWGSAVVYREASLALVCRKIYSLPMAAQGIPQEIAAQYYKTDAPHTIFFGEVLTILQSEDHRHIPTETVCIV